MLLSTLLVSIRVSLVNLLSLFFYCSFDLRMAIVTQYVDLIVILEVLIIGWRSLLLNLSTVLIAQWPGHYQHESFARRNARSD